MEKKEFDYKKPEELEKYINRAHNIKPRRKTGLSEKEQRDMVKAVKRARHLGLMQRKWL